MLRGGCSAHGGVGLAGVRDPTPPRGVTGTSCGDLIADTIREFCFSKKKDDINAKNKGHPL